MAETETLTVDQRIAGALAELRSARVLFDHSPNGDTELSVKQAELRLDALLESR